MIDLKSLSSTWLIEERFLNALDRLGPARWFKADGYETRPIHTATAPMRKQAKGKIAVVDVHGIIEQRMSLWGWLFGSFSTEEGEQILKKCARDDGVSCIVLNIDSPGGTSYGVEEFAACVRDCNAEKPCYAIANSMAASAAYWIGSQARQLACTPSGEVGSIGAYMVHMDYSQQLAEDGVKATIVKAGKYKAEGNPYEPLSDEGKDQLQATVDALYTKFVKAVAAGRGVSPETVRGASYGQGRCLQADAALKAGMVDKVLTFSQLLDKLGGDGLVADGARASAEILQLRQARRKALLKAAG